MIDWWQSIFLGDLGDLKLVDCSDLSTLTWDRWATLIFSAIAATGALVTGLVNLARHHRETAQSTLAENRRWSLEISPQTQGGWREATVIRKEDGGSPVRLRSIKIERPRSSLLALPQRQTLIGALDRGVVNLRIPDLSQTTPKLVIERDLVEAERFAFPGSSGRVGLGYATIAFYVSLPRPSIFSRWQSSRRAKMIIEAEEISSTRRNFRVEVTSQPIV